MEQSFNIILSLAMGISDLKLHIIKWINHINRTSTEARHKTDSCCMNLYIMKFKNRQQFLKLLLEIRITPQSRKTVLEGNTRKGSYNASNVVFLDLDTTSRYMDAPVCENPLSCILMTYLFFLYSCHLIKCHILINEFKYDNLVYFNISRRDLYFWQSSEINY